MTVKEIVTEYLTTHGYDGLYEPDTECGCTLDCLALCGQMLEVCQPAYRHKCESGECEWHMMPSRDPASNFCPVARDKEAD